MSAGGRWRLDGRLALVTGASRGIGLACARELAGLGAQLLLVARDGDRLEATASELAEEFPDSRPRVFAADLADAEQRLDVIDWLRDQAALPHMLVNNIGDNISRPALDYDAGQLDWLIRTNVLSAWELSRLCQPLLREHGTASIVNIASVSGLVHVRTGAPYGLTKAALIHLTRTLAEHDDVDAIWYFGDEHGSMEVEFRSAGNMKRTWVSYGQQPDWNDPIQGEGEQFLRHATQVKNIWAPMGE